MEVVTDNTGLSTIHNSFRIGIRRRVFNASLDAALKAKEKELGIPRYKLAKVMGVSQHTLFTYLSFHSYPREERRLQIAIFLERQVDELFPEKIAGVRIMKQPEPLTFTLEELESAGLAQWNPGELAEQDDLKRVLGESVATLTEREQYVIRNLYGLGDARARTVEEIAKDYRVTRARINQIRNNALRKLRHPSRSRRFLDYMERPGDALNYNLTHQMGPRPRELPQTIPWLRIPPTETR